LPELRHEDVAGEIPGGIHLDLHRRVLREILESEGAWPMTIKAGQIIKLRTGELRYVVQGYRRGCPTIDTLEFTDRRPSINFPSPNIMKVSLPQIECIRQELSQTRTHPQFPRKLSVGQRIKLFGDKRRFVVLSRDCGTYQVRPIGGDKPMTITVKDVLAVTSQ
jgi:hypothetical protein